MKYPLEQFEVLKKSIGILSEVAQVQEMNPSALHFEIYQQFGVGLEHNALVVSGGKLMRLHIHQKSEQKDSVARPLIDIDFDFKLYPEGCHDTHCETAVKKAIKELKSEGIIKS